MTYTYGKYDSDGNFVGLASSSRPITKSRWALVETDLEQDQLVLSRLVDGRLVFDKEPQKAEFFLSDEDLILSVKQERDALLQQSDWTQVPDAPVDQVAWAAYRQALRDIPQQEGFPADVNWPVAP